MTSAALNEEKHCATSLYKMEYSGFTCTKILVPYCLCCAIHTTQNCMGLTPVTILWSLLSLLLTKFETVSCLLTIAKKFRNMLAIALD